MLYVKSEERKMKNYGVAQGAALLLLRGRLHPERG